MLFTDQMGREVALPDWPPRRIVSLVPSQTEFLAALGLEHEVLGITKFCVHPPEWFQHKKRIGGTKTVDIQKVAALAPDLVIGNKEENDQAQIEALADRFPVWMSDVLCLSDALDMMQRVGEITGKSEQAQPLLSAISSGFDALQHSVKRRASAAYLIWRKPYMAAASGTFVDDMLRITGFDNVFADFTRYPEISAELLAARAPAFLLLSSEPYPFSEKHIAALQEICPATRIALVDGEMFSWYGSRLLQAPEYFEKTTKLLGV